jgi:hypothetical protein
MEDEGIAAIGVDKAELSAPAERNNPGAGQTLAEISGKGAAKGVPAQLDTRDTLSEQHLFQAAHGGFDFGKLGHAPSLRGARR